MGMGLNPLRFIIAITAQVGPVVKGLMQKGLNVPTRVGAGSYSHTPDNTTALPLIGNAALDVVPCLSLLGPGAGNTNGSTVIAAGPVINVTTFVVAAATDNDFVVFGLSVD